jgi:hypothetical protein
MCVFYSQYICCLLLALLITCILLMIVNYHFQFQYEMYLHCPVVEIKLDTTTAIIAERKESWQISSFQNFLLYSVLYSVIIMG